MADPAGGRQGASAIVAPAAGGRSKDVVMVTGLRVHNQYGHATRPNPSCIEASSVDKTADSRQVDTKQNYIDNRRTSSEPRRRATATLP
jgi:hypothetical protein